MLSFFRRIGSCLMEKIFPQKNCAVFEEIKYIFEFQHFI